MAQSVSNLYKTMMNLRLLYCVLALLGVGTVLNAQKSNFPKSVWLGLSGSIHLSRYQFTPSVSQNQHLGSSMGLLGRIDLEKGASLELGLNYTQTGWQERYDDNTSLSFKREIKYIEMPILTHLYLESKAVRFFVNVGPFLGAYLSDKSIVSGDGFSEAQLLRQTMPIKSKVAWGLTGGPGVSLKIGRRHRVEAEGYVLYNFQDIWSTHRQDPYGGSAELRLGASLRYLFQL